ncbi:hypothetical protein ACN2WE_24080 [Streptomyces sp. cg28]|uniref:hypothetical protein n=1 Tax=Streptomyces sp. cg28 TaxID=3403457 RepID=UPI003B20CD7A
MTGDLIAAAILVAPGAVFAAVTLTGHARARRADDALAYALMTYPGPNGPGGPGPGEPQPVPESTGTPSAVVIDFMNHRRTGIRLAPVKDPGREAS